MNGEAEQRLAEIADRHGLTATTVTALRAILRILAADEQAPTSIREPSHAVDVHIADALVALEVDAVRTPARVVDLGAGAGIPGLPLAAALPHSAFTLVESQSRKCAFIERAQTLAGISNARVLCARVEEWRSGAGGHDLALARAVAPAPVVLEYAAPLLELGGALVDWRGKRNPEEEHQAGRACAELGLTLEEVRRVQPFPGATDRHLHIYRKVAPTPSRYPRRPGVARKRPLGGSGRAATRPDRDHR
jgi:16S rRNA (guanine527-N7)-methyltransferase